MDEPKTYVIRGQRYSTVPQYFPWDEAKMFPSYEPLEEMREFTKEDGVPQTSLDDCELWLLKNHPDYYFGCNIECSNGNFFLNAVPSYFEEIYKTTDRDKILELILKSKENKNREYVLEDYEPEL